MIWRQPADLVLTQSIILEGVGGLAKINDRIKDIVKAKLLWEDVLHDLQRAWMNDRSSFF